MVLRVMRASGKRRATVVFGGVALAAMMSAIAAAGENRAYRTTTGHELDLPPVSTLNCAQLDRVLTRIGGTNYRPLSPPERATQRPSDPADGALYDYEHAASTRLASHCGGAAPAQGFSSFTQSGNWGFGR